MEQKIKEAFQAFDKSRKAGMFLSTRGKSKLLTGFRHRDFDSFCNVSM